MTVLDYSQTVSMQRPSQSGADGRKADKGYLCQLPPATKTATPSLLPFDVEGH